MTARSSSTQAALPTIPHPWGRHRYLVVLVVISLPFIALLALNLHAARVHVRSTAISHAEDLCMLLETRLRLRFDAAEHVVALMVQPMAMRPEAMHQAQAPLHRAATQAWLRTHLYSLVPHSTLTYVDDQGRRIYTSATATTTQDTERIPGFDLLNLLSFKEAAEGAIVYSMGSGPTPVFHMGQAIWGAHHTFLGVAVVTTDLHALRDELPYPHVGPGHRITLHFIDNDTPIVESPGSGIDVGGGISVHAQRAIGTTPVTVAVDFMENADPAKGERMGQASMVLGLIFLFILATALFLMNRAARARERSEEKLRASELRFRRLVDNHRAVILQIDPDSGRIVDANAAASRFYGWHHAELCALSISDINCLPPEQVRAALEQSKHGTCTHFVFPHRLKDGEIRTVDVHATPIDIEERIVLVAIIFDITDRIRDEENIQRLMQEQKAILDGQLIGIAKLHQRHIMWANNAFAAMFGYRTEVLVGMSARSFYADEADFIRFGTQAYPAIQNGSCYRDTLRLQRQDGSIGWFDVNIAPLFAGSDIAIMAFVDVTARMKSQLALQESEERFRTLAHYTYDMETWLGPDGRLIYISPACERVSGYAASDYMADPGLLDRIVLEEDRERVIEACRLGPDDAPCDLSFRIRHKNGDIRWMARGIRPVHATDGRHLGLRANDRDITELKQAEQLAQSLAHADPLTGLPNRRMLMERLTQSLLLAQRFHRPLGLIFIDLNGFKQVNDQWGHETGDELLRQVARRLGECVRASDTVARIGGDEFVILLSELSLADDATHVADKILQAFVEPMHLSEHTLMLSMSMGITLPHPERVRDAREVMAQADQAMYSVKRSGRHGWTLFQDPAPHDVTS